MSRGLTAYLLAAGEGRRFGRSKPLAPFHGRTVLDRVASAFRPHVLEVALVARMEDEPLLSEAARLGLRVVANPNPELGMASSVAVAVTDCRTEWLALCPCDLPLLTSEIVGRVVRALDAGPLGDTEVIQPEAEGRRKHPVILKRSWIEAFLPQLAEDTPLREILEKARALTVPFHDPLPFRDFDTRQEYESLLDEGAGEVK